MNRSYFSVFRTECGLMLYRCQGKTAMSGSSWLTAEKSAIETHHTVGCAHHFRMETNIMMRNRRSVAAMLITHETPVNMRLYEFRRTPLTSRARLSYSGIMSCRSSTRVFIISVCHKSTLINATFKDLLKVSLSDD